MSGQKQIELTAKPTSQRRRLVGPVSGRRVIEDGCIFGMDTRMPMPDAKRRCGDMSHYPLDSHRTLGRPDPQRRDEDFIRLTDDQESAACRRRSEMLPVLQLFVENADFSK